MKLLELYNNLKNKLLLSEGVSPNKVVDAIKGTYRVNIYYEGDDNTAAGKRTIEVYAYGLSNKGINKKDNGSTTSNGNPVIRAYQIFGDSKTKIVPSWKLFRLDRISKWEPTGFIFYKPISDYSPNIPKFNPNGDKSMTTVYSIVDFK